MAPTSWDDLPPALLDRCLRTGSPSDQDARFATCTSFAKAMLLPNPDLKDPKLLVHVDDFRPALVPVLRWAAEECRFLLVLACLNEARQPASLQPLLALWQQEGVILRGVRNVVCLGLLLDTDSLSAVLPNLQQLQLERCQVAEGMVPLAGCDQLQNLVLDAGNQEWAEPANSAPPAAWYVQLASLPNLASLTINPSHHPTSFLPLLADQLIHLHLISRRYVPEQEWQAAIEHTAQVTNLRSLQLSSECSPQQLTTLSNLPHLQQLVISSWGHPSDRNGDAALSALLQFPHLTSLMLPHTELEQSHADQPCSWRELMFPDAVTPQLLARLPLQSVSLLRFQGLALTSALTAHDVELAIANLARGQPEHVGGAHLSPNVLIPAAKFCIAIYGGSPAGDGLPTWLPIIAPLVPRDITAVTLRSVRPEEGPANAAWVVALQQAMPPAITSLTLHNLFISPSFWPQLATSFPQLKKLRIQPNNMCSPEAVMSYYMAACEAQHAPGMQQVADVKIDPHWRKEHWELAADFTQLNEQLRLLGLTATVSLSSSVG